MTYSTETISYSDLTGLAEPHSRTEPLHVTRNNKFGDNPIVSVCMPIFNKAGILAEILRALVGSMTLPYELILIDDASADGSYDIARDALEALPEQSWTLIKSPVPLYETACDNIGLALSRGTYFLEVQSDIFVADPGFDKRLIRALEHGNLSSISGRGCHGFGQLLSVKEHIRTCFINGFRPQHLIADFIGKGLLGDRIERGHNRAIPHDLYWSAQTNNRGPWLVRLDWARKMGMLNSQDFFLGNDDHDFNFRSAKVGRLAGYAPVNITAALEDGSTRQPRTGLNLEIYQELRQTKRGEDALFQQLRNEPSNAPKKMRIPAEFDFDF